MSKRRVLILGSTGFVGKNLLEIIGENHDTTGTSRNIDSTSRKYIYFDLFDVKSWHNVIENNPEIIINSIGYGVIKSENETERIFAVNYYQTITFFDFLFSNWKGKFIQLGTAFEYDLSERAITEETFEFPKTFYGISKLMASKYLIEKFPNRSIIILRPFNMFGAHEDLSKIIPALIFSLKYKKTLELSSGTQKRDYFLVNDLGWFVVRIIERWNDSIYFPTVINIGSGKSISLKEIAGLIQSELSVTTSTDFWKWGLLPGRINESDEFYNASELCHNLGFEQTDLKTAIRKTINTY